MEQPQITVEGLSNIILGIIRANPAMFNQALQLAAIKYNEELHNQPND